MKYLILIDREYPYKSGEPFLESEIDNLSKSFDKVLIYPIDICLNENQTRKIFNSNVNVNVVNNKGTNYRKVNALFKGILNTIKDNRKVKLLNKIYDNYFIQLSHFQGELIKENLKKYNFKKNDEVYLYSYWLYTPAQIVCNISELFIGKVKKLKLISRAHGFDVYEYRNRLNYLPNREKLFSKLDAIIVCSKDGADYLKSKYPNYKNKFFTSYLGTKDHGFIPYCNKKEFRIISCSRMVDVKRINLIIEALSYFKNTDYKISWTHIGSGPLYKKLLKYSKKKLNFMEVNFTGNMSNEKVFEYYKKNNFNLFLNVSSSEGIPVSIMEAISYGIPIIATNVGGTKEIVYDGENGFLLQKNFQSVELVNLIKQIYNMDEKEYYNLKMNSRIIWEKQFNSKVNYEKFCTYMKK